MEQGFFKVFLPENSTKRMKIPVAFTDFKNGKFPRKVVLRDRFGNVWPIGVIKIEGSFYFDHGWEKFIEDNTVEFGDFLVFYPDGNRTFNFKLLGINGCEKKGAGGLILIVNEEEYEDEEEEETEEKEEEEENETIETSNKKALHSKAGRKKFTTHKAEGVHDKFGADIFKSGRATQPKNPYFVTKVRSNRKDQLYVPIDPVRDYKLELPSSMSIRDSAGREFETKLKIWKDGRIWLSGGWHSLCRWNLLKVNDKCICEFVRGNNGLYLQVHVLHEGEGSQPEKNKK